MTGIEIFTTINYGISLWFCLYWIYQMRRSQMIQKELIQHAKNFCQLSDAVSAAQAELEERISVLQAECPLTSNPDLAELVKIFSFKDEEMGRIATANNWMPCSDEKLGCS